MSLRGYFKNIYDEIQGSRSIRRDAGFVTGLVELENGSPYYRNVDALPSFEEWLGAETMKLIERSEKMVNRFIG